MPTGDQRRLLRRRPAGRKRRRSKMVVSVRYIVSLRQCCVMLRQGCVMLRNVVSECVSYKQTRMCACNDYQSSTIRRKRGHVKQVSHAQLVVHMHASHVHWIKCSNMYKFCRQLSHYAGRFLCPPQIMPPIVTLRRQTLAYAAKSSLHAAMFLCLLHILPYMTTSMFTCRHLTCAY